MAVPYTQANYEALVAAIATGAKSVKYADKEIVYRTYDEMKRIKAEMELVVDPGSITGSRRNRRVGQFRNGK